MSFKRRILPISQQLWEQLKTTFALKQHTHSSSDITNVIGMSLITFSQTSSLTFTIDNTTRILILASATKIYGDTNQTVNLTLDDVVVHSGIVGDWVAKDGKGGGANECTLAALKTVNNGSHTVSINNFTTGFIMVLKV